MEAALLTLVVLHFAAAVLAPVLVRQAGARAFYGLALPSLATVAFAITQTGTVVSSGATSAIEQRLSWVPSLGLDITLRLDALRLVMTFVVAGIGALVLIYCAKYFSDDEPGLGRLAGTLTAFAGAMLGLVWSDNLLLLYVFWELTTVLSFLLIGHDPGKRASRLAALQALIVTTFGGLAMLVGILLLYRETGTLATSELLAAASSSASSSAPGAVPASTALVVGVVLLLLGAITKSALVPFHFWLPGAMAAPTPVSAYLHAAAMVKAGVFLVALLAPRFAGVPGWHLVLLPLGVVTMLIGGFKAMRQYDLKLLLAYGTVSQLGFLITLLALGSRAAALAGIALVLSHSLFKSALFLTVGIIDHQTGTRDLRKLTGVGRAMPVTMIAAVLAGLSMAGLPPLLGFAGKESAFAALLTIADSGDGTGLDGTTGWVLLTLIVIGSGLTVGYTARFLWGAFADKHPEPRCAVRPPAPAFVAVPVLLAALSLVLAFLGGPLTRLFTPYTEQFPAGAHDEPLALWHGFGMPLALSALVVLLGGLVFVIRRRVSVVQHRLTANISTERAYHAVIRAIDRLAIEVTGATQRGSLAVYLAVILVVVVVVPGGVMIGGGPPKVDFTAWDSPVQPMVGMVIAVAALFAARSRRRMRAVLLAGVTGYGTAVLFLLHGAPDLALTQILVETVSLLVFVLVLRRLPSHFTDRPLPRNRFWRIALGTAVGLTVCGFLVVAASARTATPLTPELARAAVDFGGGYNIVNVILVDTRAWDTFGEISVLVVAATGVASLIFIDTRVPNIRRVHEISYPSDVVKLPTRPGRRAWLPGPRTMPPERRSIIFEVVTRMSFHLILAVGAYLLFAGHNNPGGGFAAGLVVGSALAIRYLVGGRYELDEAAPVDAGVVLGLGLCVAAVSALLPLAFGGEVLQTATIEADLPLLGSVKLVTSLLFDIGVLLVVVALLLDLLRSLGSGIDRQIRREQREGSTA